MSGMEPALIAALVGGGMGGLGAAFGQQSDVKPFSADENDPEMLLAQGLAGVRNLTDLRINRAAEPISLPGAFVQQPPTFVGGGSPMPIGVTGQDDPTLMASSIPGITGAPDDFYGPINLESSVARPGGGKSPSWPRPHPSGWGGGGNRGSDPGDSRGRGRGGRKGLPQRSLTASVSSSLAPGGAMFGGGQDPSIEQAEGAMNLLTQAKMTPIPQQMVPQPTRRT